MWRLSRCVLTRAGCKSHFEKNLSFAYDLLNNDLRLDLYLDLVVKDEHFAIGQKLS